MFFKESYQQEKYFKDTPQKHHTDFVVDERENRSNIHINVNNNLNEHGPCEKFPRTSSSSPHSSKDYAPHSWARHANSPQKEPIPPH
jgi:hypothetical protein